MKRPFAGGGVDGFQALELAFQSIGVRFYLSDFYKEGRLYWFEPGHPGLGLPHPDDWTESS